MTSVQRSIYKEQKRTYFSTVRRAKGLFNYTNYKVVPSQFALVQNLLTPGVDHRSHSTLKPKSEEINADYLITRLSSLSPQRGRRSVSPTSPSHPSVSETLKRINSVRADLEPRARTLPRVPRTRKRSDRMNSLKMLISRCEGMLTPSHRKSTRTVLAPKRLDALVSFAPM